MKTCQEDTCDAAVWARGLCQKHYSRWYRRTHTIKKVDRTGYHQQWYLDNRERLLARQRERRLEDPERERRRYQRYKEKDPERWKRDRRRAWAKRLYGLTLEEADAILARGCALCGTHEGKICMDHDHTNGKVRDALCQGCNTGLGQFGDDPARLRAAANYIDQHRGGDAK